MSTPTAGNTSHTPRYLQQDTTVTERASTPTSDSDNDSTRAQLGKRHRITKSDSSGAGLQPSAMGPNRLNFSDADDIWSQFMRIGCIKDNEDDYLGDGPEVLQGRGYPASRSVSRPQQSSRADTQGYSSSAHTPHQAFERSPSPCRQPPIGYASEQMLSYSDGYFTFNRNFTPSDRSAVGTTVHLAPHRHSQYSDPPPGYFGEPNYAVPSFSAPYQPIPQHFSPPELREVNQSPAAGLADLGYDRTGSRSDLSIDKRIEKRRDKERSASPDRGPGPNRIMRGPPPVPNYNYGGSKPYHSASPTTSRSTNAVTFSAPNEVFESFLPSKSLAHPPSALDVPLSPRSPSTTSSTENHSAFSLPYGASQSGYALPVADLLSDLSLIENEVLPKADFITQWQEAMGARQDTTEGITVQMIYHACMECYHAMLPSWYTALEGKDTVKHTLYRNHILLRDWGASYAVLDGQLDQLPKEAEDITETILLFLTEISTILISSKTMKSTLKSTTDEFRNSKVDRPGVEC
jgi:hypothetical protein